MGFVYVARSAELANWGSDVGVGKYLFKLGYTEGSAEEAVKALSAAAHAGVTDWALVRKEAVDGVDEATLLARLGRKEKMLDTALYPRLKGAADITKVKLVNVENHRLLKQAYGNEALKVTKLRNTDIAAYLIANALG
jgi:hypothetical protein